MKMRGRLLDITQDILNGGFQLRLAVGAIPSGVERLREETDLAITLTKWREQRSLTANAYYWVLVGKIADAVHTSQAVVHNLLLRQYGVLDTIDGETLTVFIPDTQEAEDQALKDELRHMRPTSNVKEGKNGKMFRAYRLIKGSSRYDSKEFSTLLDGAVEECRDMGLEVLPPEEIARMEAEYAKHYGH